MGVRHLVAAAAIQCILFALCSTASASTACPSDLDVPDATTAPTAASALFCDVNELRAQNDLAPLRWDWRLWAAAERMAVDMSARHFFSHVTPDGLTLADRVVPTGYLPDNDTWLLTENLAWGQGVLSSPLSIAYGWMDSPEHRVNLLDPAVQDVGIGVAPGPDDMGGMIYVADFGSRGEPTAPARGEPTAPTAPAKLTVQSLHLRLRFVRAARALRRPTHVAKARRGGSVRLHGRHRHSRR
jgi:uncharacterized protein YkwD